MKKGIAMFLALALTTVSMAACGSNSTENQEGTKVSESVVSKTDASEVTEGSEEEEAPAVEAGDFSGQTEVVANPGGTTFADIAGANRDVVNVAISADLGNYGPFAPAEVSAPFLNAVYEPYGYVIDGEFYGVLVKDYELAEDGLSMVFNLYDYIYDSEGNHITADDALFSWETGKESGYITQVAYVDTLEKVGDYSIRVNFNRALNVGDLDVFWQFYVVSEKAYTESGDGMTSKPVGTGHYTVTDYTPNYMVTVEARDNYWQTDELTNARDAANVQTINYYFITESTQRTLAMENGTIDMCYEINTEDLGEFMPGGAYDEQYNCYAGIANLSWLLFPNCSESSLCSDVNLRKAIFYSIDTKTILESAFSGLGSTMYDITPQWATGYQTEWNTQDNYYNYNPETAAEYLAESGYNGETLRILSAGSSPCLELIQAFLQNAGINCELVLVDFSIFTESLSDAEGWDIVLLQYATNSYSPDGWSKVMQEGNFEYAQTINHIQDDHLQELLTEASSLETYSDESVGAFHDYFVENAYGMGLVNPASYWVVPSDVETVTVSFKNYILPGGCTYKAE